VNRTNRPNTWLLRLPPQVKKTLADLEPSTHAPTRISGYVRVLAAVKHVADIKRALIRASPTSVSPVFCAE
jgi:hypothetical protein